MNFKSHIRCQLWQYCLLLQRLIYQYREALLHIWRWKSLVHSSNINLIPLQHCHVSYLLWSRPWCSICGNELLPLSVEPDIALPWSQLKYFLEIDQLKFQNRAMHVHELQMMNYSQWSWAWAWCRLSSVSQAKKNTVGGLQLSGIKEVTVVFMVGTYWLGWNKCGYLVPFWDKTLTNWTYLT